MSTTDVRDDVIRSLQIQLANSQERYESLASKYHVLVQEREVLLSQKSIRDVNVRRQEFKVELMEKAVSAGLMWIMSKMKNNG